MTVSVEDLLELLPELIVEGPLAPRYNIAPGQAIVTIPNKKPQRLTFTQWGLVPEWADHPGIGSRLFNARAETLAEKNAFRHAFRRRRCLIPADGFYEWATQAQSKNRQPWFFYMKDRRPFAFAGLWEEWCDREGGVLATSTIVTTHPNACVAPVHNRMPVILAQESFPAWLSPDEQSPKNFRDLLKPFPAEKMASYPVSRYVNNIRNDDPQCIEQRAAPCQQALF